MQNLAKKEMNKMVDRCSQKIEDLGVQIRTKKLTSKEPFKCQASDLYRALTDKAVSILFIL